MNREVDYFCGQPLLLRGAKRASGLPEVTRTLLECTNEFFVLSDSIVEQRGGKTVLVSVLFVDNRSQVCGEIRSEGKTRVERTSHFPIFKTQFCPPWRSHPTSNYLAEACKLEQKASSETSSEIFLLCFVCLFDWSAPSAALDSFHSRHRVKRAICLFNAPLRACVRRSMQKLTQLERLDLGSNEFTEVVSISLPVCLQGPGALFFLFFYKPYQSDLIFFVHIDFFRLLILR